MGIPRIRLSLFLALFLAIPCQGEWEEYDRRYGQWSQGLISAYQNGEGAVPPSFNRYGWWDRSKNELLARVALWKMNRVARDRGSEASTPAPMDRVRAYIERVERFPLSLFLNGSLLQKVKSLAQPNPSGPLSGVLSNLDNYTRDYLEDVEGYRQRFGGDFFTEEAVARGLLNVVAMRLFADINGTHAPRHAMNAIALLHPVTDEAIDSGQVKPETLKKLTRYLQGTPLKGRSRYEKMLFGFLEHIYEAYPRDEHPLLDWALNTLHKEQLASTQQSKGMAERELLRISFTKGGLSTLGAGYISLGSLNERQQALFFQAGGAFQLLDDFQDIPEDSRDGIETVWTRSLRRQGGIERPLKRLLGLETYLEERLPDWATGFEGAQAMAAIYPFAFKATVVKGFQRNLDNHAVTKGEGVLRQLLPLRPTLASRVYSASQALMRGEVAHCPETFQVLMRANDLY